MERCEILGQDDRLCLAEPPVRRTLRSSVLASVARCLGSRYMPLVLILIAVLVSLPAVREGRLNDDYMQQAILTGPSPLLERLDTKGLAPPGSGKLGPILSDLYIAVAPGRNLESLQAYGALPWWTCEGYRVAFWRPVAALTYWFDYRLWPDSLVSMHLHSLLWFGLLVGLIAALYRRFIDAAPVAGLAALLFVLDDAGYFPTMWLANRNLLVCLSFGVLTILLHDRWRRGRWRPAAVLAPLCLLASVLSAEAGVAAVAYLIAYELTLATGRRTRRLLALTPAAAVIVVWRLIYNALGYGASDGGFYFDPVREPIGYLLAFFRRAPFMLAGQWTTVPPELHSFLPPTSRNLLWLALSVATVLILLVLWRFARSHRRARFWLLGMVLAVIPFCATLPMSRSLLFVALGGFGLIAEFIAGWLADAWDDEGRVTRLQPIYARPRWLWGSARNLFALFVVVHIPLAAAGRILAPHVADRMEQRVARTMDLGPMEGLDGRDLVIVNAPNPASFLYEPFFRAAHDQTLPRALRVLAPGFDAVEVTRQADNVITVRSLADSLFDCQREGERIDFVFFYRFLSDVRGSGHPLRPGDRIRLDRMTAEVLAVDAAGLPRQVAFEFDVPLEDPCLRWLWWNWDEHRYETFTPPAVGQAATLVGPF